MKHLLLIVLLFLLVVPAAAQEDDCNPEQVGEWMVQRQVIRNQTSSILQGEILYLPVLVQVQQHRRDIEALERPACADELFYLTMYLYETVSDQLSFLLAEALDVAVPVGAQEALDARYAYYDENISALYDELEAIAGIDVEAAADEIQPSPTDAPPPATPEITESDGAITITGNGSVVLDPMDFPDAIYRATFEADGFASVSIEGLSGDCGYLSLTVYTAGESSSEVYRPENCRGLLEVTNATGDWTFILEPVE